MTVDPAKPDTWGQAFTDHVRFRVGRKIGRTLYLAGLVPDDDPVVGMMDSPELAQYIADAVDERAKLREALAFYADRVNYAPQNPPGTGSPIWQDAGRRAREALNAEVQDAA